MRNNKFNIYILVVLIICTIIIAISFNNNYLTGVFENTYRNKYERSISTDKLNYLFNELDIQEKSYIWTSSLEYGNKPKSIVIHHAASEATVDEVDKIHKNKGWCGIGYHYYIETDGTIYRGRPEEAIGAHVQGHNENTIGICVQGNFEEKELGVLQEESLIDLLAYLSYKYPIGIIEGHNDLASTLCPGKNNSIDDIKLKVETKMKEISKLK